MHPTLIFNHFRGIANVVPKMKSINFIHCFILSIMRNSSFSAIVIISFVTLLVGCQSSTEHVGKKEGYPISAIDIKRVTLTDSFWLPKIRLIQDTTIHHAFEKCLQEGRMENFLIAGKKKEGVTRGKMPFDDTDLYKIIEGASYSLVSIPDPRLEAYLDSIIAIIKVGQEPDGYITTWFTIDRAHPPANWVKPSTHRWENEISSHELYNSGHLFEAAAAHYWVTGKKNFLEIATRNADLLVSNFGKGKLSIPPGHEIVETGLIKLYTITHNKQYLELAKYFIDVRGDSTTHHLYGAYNQDHMPVATQEEAVGHAVRGEYLYAGVTDIAAICRDSSYEHALNKIWNNVVEKKTYITGGVGARHEGEAFGDNYELPNLSAYAETCAAIGSVAWNQRMFMLHGDSKYYDVLERTLYNGLISGISTDGTKFFYPNPLESDGKFKFNQGAATRQSWFDCSCCPTNMIRFLPTLPGLIYASQGDTVFVNLFVSSDAKLQAGNATIDIRQQTGYPWDGAVKITVVPEKDATFSLRIRVPGWARNKPFPGTLYHYADASPTQVSLRINGEENPVDVSQGYIMLNRAWQPNDVVELSLPMEVREVVTNDLVRDNKNKVAVEVGPIVYCMEAIDNKNFDAMTFPAPSGLHITREHFLGEHVNLVHGRTSSGEITLIPYYLWSNRGIGKMKVWN